MAENFMAQHSILREKNILENSIKKNTSSTITINSNNNNNVSNNNIFSHKEVFYNFDKKKFIGKLNGFTKFLISLGTLNSPNDNFYSKKIDEKNILHYVYIPSIVRTTNEVSQKKKEENLKIFDESELFDKKNDFNTDKNFNLNNLISGDTFLLKSKWIESQQTEILSQNNKNLFISGKLNLNKNQNFNNFYCGNEEKKKIRKSDNKTMIIENKNNDISSVSITSSSSLSSLSSLSSSSSSSSSSSVCVKFIDHVGGVWPTTQVINIKINIIINMKIKIKIIYCRLSIFFYHDFSFLISLELRSY